MFKKLFILLIALVNFETLTFAQSAFEGVSNSDGYGTPVVNNCPDCNRHFNSSLLTDYPMNNSQTVSGLLKSNTPGLNNPDAVK